MSITDAQQRHLGDSSNEQSRLEHYKAELGYFLEDIQDADLREACNEWLVAATQAESNGLDDRVTRRLNEISKDNPMFVDGGKEVEECFPDDCRGCDHYGELCPVIADRVRSKERERIMQEAETQQELERGLSNYAHKVGCGVIEDAINQDTEYEDLVDAGELLVRAVQEQLVHTDLRDEMIRDRLVELGWL